MQAYLDLRLLPDPEFPATVLMNALFAKLHRALVTEAGGRLGVSFPATGSTPPTLGNRLRLHGEAAALTGLMALDWLSGMHDHVALSALAEIPGHARFRVVRRVQAQSSPQRLRRRLSRRHGYDAAAARRHIPDSAAERLDLPYVILNSRSTGQQFRLFIEHGPLLDKPVPGTFSSYGLSAQATVPWF